MHKRRIILLNIVFVILTVFFLILSLILNFVFLIPFFFLPIICWLPFVFKGKKRGMVGYEPYAQPQKFEEINQAIRYCPVCKGEIKEPIAKFCYHCSAKLNNDN